MNKEWAKLMRIKNELEDMAAAVELGDDDISLEEMKTWSKEKQLDLQFNVMFVEFLDGAHTKVIEAIEHLEKYAILERT